MKIQSLPPIAHADTPSASSGGPSADSTGKHSPATKVSLSSDAGFVDNLREKASPAPFRPDMVAEMKAQIAAGTFDDNVNMDRVVDGLMAGL
jgi:anti-sigma28 factor (negative regulator of flagellin synthesis)